MARSGLSRTAVTALAVACLLAGCSGTDNPPSPTRLPGPPGPPLSGRLLVQTKDDKVWALRASGGVITATLTASATGAAALSPDGKTLAYVTATGLVLKDLATGAVRSLGSGAGDTVTTGFGDCLAWSPDGRRLLFLAAGGLYATTLDGVLTVIDLPRRAAYVPMATGRPGFPDPVIPNPEQDGPSTDVTSQVTCGAWLDADRVVFDRLTGAMPNAVHPTDPATGPTPVAADTTTVAALTGAHVRLTDSPSRWTLAGVCGSRLLTRRVPATAQESGGVPDGSALYLLNGLPTAALARPDGATPANAAIPHPHGVAMATFVPGSCGLLVVDPEANQQGSFDTFRLDPATRTLQPGKPLHAYLYFQPGSEIWAPGTNQTVFAEFSRGEDDVRLVDVATGGVTVPDLPDAQRPHRLRALIGWVP